MIICVGQPACTLFLGNMEAPAVAEEAEKAAPSSAALVAVSSVKIEVIARGAREGSRKLQDLKSEERSAVLMKIALSLEEREKEILAVNDEDVAAAKKA